MCAGEEHRYSSHYNKKRKHEEDKKQGGNNENRVEAHLSYPSKEALGCFAMCSSSGVPWHRWSRAALCFGLIIHRTGGLKVRAPHLPAQPTAGESASVHLSGCFVLLGM